MSFGRLLGNLVSDITRGNVQRGFSRFVRDAQNEAAKAAQKATQSAVEGAMNKKKADADEEMSEEAAWALIQAMVAAAGADGNIDPDETKKIMDKAKEAELSPADMQKLELEMAAPKSAEAVAALGRDDAHKKLIYQLSIQTIVIDSQEERDHLKRLAVGLGLPYGEILAIQKELGVEKELA